MSRRSRRGSGKTTTISLKQELFPCHGCGIFFPRFDRHIRFKVVKKGGGIETARIYCTDCLDKYFAELIANGFKFKNQQERSLVVNE